MLLLLEAIPQFNLTSPGNGKIPENFEVVRKFVSIDSTGFEETSVCIFKMKLDILRNLATRATEYCNRLSTVNYSC